jgi:hypothetical protein
MAEYKPVLLYESLESLDGPENDKHALNRLQQEVVPTRHIFRGIPIGSSLFIVYCIVQVCFFRIHSDRREKT